MEKLLPFIVARMNGAKYGAPEFYWFVREQLPTEDADPICAAIDTGCEAKVKQAINEYFAKHQLYPLALHYVAAASWLTDDPEQSNALTYGTYVTMHSTEHAQDTADDEYEIECEYQADARRTLKRQVIAAYEQALRHGHKPWRSLIIELPRNQWGIDLLSIRCGRGDRARVKDVFTAQHEQNRHLPPAEQKEAILPNTEILVTAQKADGTEFEIRKVVTLHVKHQHISAYPREWYLQNGR